MAFDSRQTEHRSSLPRLSDQSKPTLKQLLPQLDTELTPLFELRESSTPDRVLNVGAGLLQNSDTGLSRSFAPINTQYFTFSGGTVTFPASSGGTITVSPGTNNTLTVSSGNYIACLVQVSSTGNLSVVLGTQAASAASAISSANFPIPSKSDLSIGYVVLQNSGGTIQNVINENIVQFSAGAGAGSGTGSSGINYFSANPDFEISTLGFNTYADAAGDAPVDGTGGSPSTTFTRSTSAPLRGTASGLFSKTGSANRRGEGFSYDNTIDTADQGKIQEVSFDYTTSTDYVDGYMRCYVYDITNATMIELPQRDILANANQAKYISYFQPAVNSTSYRVIWHITTSTTTNWDFKIDNIKLGPPAISQSGRTVACRAYLASADQTISSSSETTVQLNATSYDYAGMSSVGSPNYGIRIQESGLYFLNANVSISNLTADEKIFFKIKNGATILSYVNNTDILSTTGSSMTNTCVVPLVKGDIITMTVDSQVDTSYNINFTTTGYVSFLEAILIKSDASSISNSTIAFKSYLGSAANHTSSGGNQKVPLAALEFDSAGGWDVVNTRWAAPESGYYHFNGSVQFTSLADGKTGQALIRVNASTVIEGSFVAGGALAGQASVASGNVFLNKGDYVELFAYQNDSASEAYNTGAHRTYLTGFKINSGSNTIAPTEFVGASYRSTGQIVSGETVVTFQSKDFDSHNAYNTSTGIYTIPVSGKYRMNTQVETASRTWVSGEGMTLKFYKNASQALSMTQRFPAQANRMVSQPLFGVLDLVKGDQIDVRATIDGNPSIHTSTISSFFMIEKVG